MVIRLRAVHAARVRPQQTRRFAITWLAYEWHNLIAVDVGRHLILCALVLPLLVLLAGLLVLVRTSHGSRAVRMGSVLGGRKPGRRSVCSGSDR